MNRACAGVACCVRCLVMMSLALVASGRTDSYTGPTTDKYIHAECPGLGSQGLTDACKLAMCNKRDCDVEQISSEYK